MERNNFLQNKSKKAVSPSVLREATQFRQVYLTKLQNML